MIFCIGCSNTKTQTKNSNETVTSVQVKTQVTTQVNIPSTIYISSISNSSRAIHYSITKNGDVSKDALAFDNNCKYYNDLDQEISFNEFATIIQASNKQSNTVKCNITIYNNKLVSEAHLTE